MHFQMEKLHYHDVFPGIPTRALLLAHSVLLLASLFEYHLLQESYCCFPTLHSRLDWRLQRTAHSKHVARLTVARVPNQSTPEASLLHP